jgi:hypothetical protein
MSGNDGNKLEEKKPYTKPTLTVDGKVSELTAAGENNAKQDSSAKKTFAKPNLAIYGTIFDLTKMVGPNGPPDGGGISGMQGSQI